MKMRQRIKLQDVLTGRSTGLEFGPCVPLQTSSAQIRRLSAGMDLDFRPDPVALSDDIIRATPAVLMDSVQRRPRDEPPVRGERSVS